MTGKKPASPPTLRSDLQQSDTHVLEASEYLELLELTEEMLARAAVRKGGRPRSASPSQV